MFQTRKFNMILPRVYDVVLSSERERPRVMAWTRGSLENATVYRSPGSNTKSSSFTVQTKTQMLSIPVLPSMSNSLASAALPWRCRPLNFLRTQTELASVNSFSFYAKLCSVALCSSSPTSPELSDGIPEQSSKRVRISFLLFISMH